MRVLLQHKKTRLWFREPRGWTENSERAKDFQSSIAAINAAIELGLQPVEVVYDFGDPAYELRLPAGPG